MRKFLPALRGGYSTGALDVTDGVEEKSLSIGGPVSGAAYLSTTRIGNGLYGTEGRADAWDMDTVISEGYERAIWVYRCVELISGDLSRLKFKAGRDRGTEREETLEDHPLYRVLNVKANQLEKAKLFKKRLVAQLLLSKRGVFVEVTKSRAGNIVRLDLLDPQRTRPIPADNGYDYIKWFEFTRRDGTVREIQPQHIRWIRQPHPTDAYSGTTPLEAAGLSIELDFLTRIYNSSFIKRDARPSGVLGVDTDSLSDQEMERIERKFLPGAHHAGAMTVIGTGPGGLNYVDTATKPRDMSYGEASTNAKVEILAAFGIGESMLGNASGRSFENADAELYNYWTQVLPTYMELVAEAFEEDLPYGGWEPYLDTSHIEVLQLPKRRDREEARTEVNQGLRSIDEYRNLANLPMLNVPQTRALWTNPSKAPIPGQPGDEQALGLGMGGEAGPDGGGMPPGPGGEPPAGPDGAPDGGAPAEPGAEGDGADAVARLEAAIAAGEVPAALDDAPEGDAADAEAWGPPTQEEIDAVDDVEGDTGDGAAAVAEVRSGEGSTPGDGAAAVAGADADMGGYTEGDGADALRRARTEGKSAEVAEMSVAAAMAAALSRQVGIITARLESPRTRKGTPFWTPDGPSDTRGGDDAIDVSKVVDVDRWELETVNTVQPLLADAGSDSAAFIAAAGAAEQMREFLVDVATTIDTAASATTSMSDVVAEVKSLYAFRAGTVAAGIARGAVTDLEVAR